MMVSRTDIQVTVYLHTVLQDFAPEGRSILEMDLPPDSTLAAVIERLGIPDYLIEILVLDGKLQDKSVALYDGAIVKIYPVFGGG